MSEQIHLRVGAEPWAPADSAKLDTTLNFYDVPLAGILAQHHRYYLFECLEGYGQQASLWAYVLITAAERRQLRKSQGARLKDLSEQVLVSRSFVAALALNDAIEIGVKVEQAPKPRSAAAYAVSRKADQVRAAGNLAFC